MYALSLILEVTRRCNMHCAHCLRGDAEDVDMPPEIMRRTLDVFTDIQDIIFTGGEPSLNVPLIKATLDELKKRNIFPSSFFIATNGKENIDELLAVCDELYYHCYNFGFDSKISSKTAASYFKTTREYQDEFIGGLALSLDQYHEPIPRENIVKIISRAYAVDCKMEPFGTQHPVINTGRAKGLDVPYKRDGEDRIKSSQLYPEDNGFETIYIATNGDIFGDCDTAYKERQATYNIMDPDVETKLTKLLED